MAENCQISNRIRTYSPDGHLITEKETVIIGRTLKECHQYYLQTWGKE